MSDLESEKASLEDTSDSEENGEDPQDTENGGDSSEHSSKSKTPSPVDDETIDPNFECDLTDVENPTARITRSKHSKSVGDIYSKAIAAQFTRKAVASQSTSTTVASQSTSTAVASKTQLPHIQPLSKKGYLKNHKNGSRFESSFQRYD